MKAIRKAQSMKPTEEDLKGEPRTCLVCESALACWEKVGLSLTDYPWKKCSKCASWMCFDCKRDTRFTNHQKNCSGKKKNLKRKATSR